MEGSQLVLSGGLASVDELYESFCEGLPEELRKPARTLAFRLRLAPEPTIPWSHVFGHAVTLRAPLLFATVMPAAVPLRLNLAVRAHMLSVIEAFGVDRIEDGQVDADATLRSVLELVRHARNADLFELGGDEGLLAAKAAQFTTESAILREHAVLRSGESVDFGRYQEISAGKQAVGIVASAVLARAEKQSSECVDDVKQGLLGVALGLQFLDDVADWEEDAETQGSWAVLLSGAKGARIAGPREERERLRRRVLESGVLLEMLENGREQFALAASAAERIEATRLSEWAREQEAACRVHVERERCGPGYFVRWKKLSPWAREVLT